jgi:uncharacterized protein
MGSFEEPTDPLAEVDTSGTVASRPMGDDPGFPAPAPVTLLTTDGVRLQGVVEAPVVARAAAVVAHPHPRYGGDQHNPVVLTLARALRALGCATLRFGFRGTGGSEGSHGGGAAERADVGAALDELASRYPGMPLLLAGYSFGADVVLSVGHPDLAGWLVVAPPLAVFPPGELVAASDPRPVVVLVPEHDQFDPPREAAARTAGWVATELHTVAMADHFLAGAGDRLAVLVCDHAPVPA